MRFLKRAWQWLGFARPASSELNFDAEVASFLHEIASQEQRKVEDVANDLLHFAMTEQQKDEEKLALWERLSPREKQVAALACLGHTNPEIGKLMVISTNTVKTHMRNLLEKVNVSSKAELRELFAGWEFEAWLKSQDLRADS
jgi:DNA-binding CsgD family transcriptional regulator